MTGTRGVIKARLRRSNRYPQAVLSSMEMERLSVIMAISHRDTHGRAKRGKMVKRRLTIKCLLTALLIRPHVSKSGECLTLTVLAGQTVTPSFHSSTPTLVNDTERGGREATTGIAMSERQGESERKPKEQPGTTATGTSRGVGSMFSKAKSLLGDK
jgi:hypothetical protein